MSKTRYIGSANLIETLTRRERSLAWLARKVGVSPQLMWFVSRGERTLSAELAYRAAHELGEPLDYLFVSTDVVDTVAVAGVNAA